MFNKRILGSTYCYENFVTKEQQKQLLEWANYSIKFMGRAKPVNNEKNQLDKELVRHFVKLNELEYVPQLVYDLRDKIIQLESIYPVVEAYHNGDWIGVTCEDSYVEPHKDSNGPDVRFYTRRYNLILSFPEEGGQPIYGGEILDVKELDIWRCDAGLVEHSSVPNGGDKCRVNLSFGFSVLKPQEMEKRSLI